MSQPDTPISQPEPTAATSFLRRWSERKRRVGEEALRPLQPLDPVSTVVQELTDADMPPLESLNEISDYSLFFSPKVSQELRRQALHKLFHSAGFNSGDGLSDYSEDYTCFESLGDLVTQDLRHRQQVEATCLSESLLADAETTLAEPVSSHLDEPELAANGPERAE